MAKIVLNDVTNINSLSVINDNFDKIEQELQDKVLYRNNTSLETNTVEQDIDFNGFRLLNVNGVVPGTDSFPAKYLGAFNSDPSVGFNGIPLAEGNLYYRTGGAYKTLRVFNGAIWVDTSPTSLVSTDTIDPSLFATSSEVANTGVPSKVFSPDALLASIGISTLWTAIGTWIVSTFKGFTQLGTGAISRTIKEKNTDVIDSSDYILIPGASDALDQAGVQAAINRAAVNGTRVRIRKPIRTNWDLSVLTIPTNVIIDDERYTDAGHTAIVTTNADTELRVHGPAVTGGEGPTLVTVNTATTGDRTSSLAARYGTGAGGNVTAFMHWGVWNGTTWNPDIDFILNGNFGGVDNFRSRVRIGAKGATIINPAGTGKNIDAASAYTAGYSFVVGRPAQDGGGYQFGVKNGAVEVPQELHLQSTNATVRFQNASGSNRFSLISDFPSTGQFQLYDHILGQSVLTVTSGGALSLNTTCLALTAVSSASASTSSIFIDSADGKLKFKNSGGTVNSLY